MRAWAGDGFGWNDRIWVIDSVDFPPRCVAIVVSSHCSFLPAAIFRRINCCAAAVWGLGGPSMVK
jgi:hypothetical protein